MEFLELVETIQAEHATAREVFAGEGFAARQAARRVAHSTKLLEATRLYERVLKGNRYAGLVFSEAMSTSDFPLLFADILDRQVLAGYREAPAIWPAIAKRATVRDFRDVKRFPRAVGAESTLDAVAAGATYPASHIDDSTPITYGVQKYGRTLPFDWETLINDDLDALRDGPARLGKAARMTEQKFVSGLYVDANGPHASLYTSGNGNIVTANPALSIAGLQTAMTVLGSMTDDEGNPIVIDMTTLVVCPALAVVAQNILNALEIRLVGAEAGATANQNLVATNWMRSKVQLVVDPWIPILATSANSTTMWALFATPQFDAAALEVGFLRGYEEPQVFAKSPNAQFVGGGAVDIMSGDFDTDSITYKVRHVVGGTRLTAKLTVASQGDGS